jgi:hypothetical protein
LGVQIESIYHPVVLPRRIPGRWPFPFFRVPQAFSWQRRYQDGGTAPGRGFLRFAIQGKTGPPLQHEIHRLHEGHVLASVGIEDRPGGKGGVELQRVVPFKIPRGQRVKLLECQLPDF